MTETTETERRGNAVQIFLVHVAESQSENIFKFDTAEKTLEFVGKVIVGQHPGTIQCIFKADTDTGTMTKYEAILNGYVLELHPEN